MQSTSVCAGAAAVVLFATAGCQKKEALIEKPAQSVRTGVAETVQSEAPVRYTATFSPLNEINLAFKTSGLIDRILQVRGADGKMRDVQPGDTAHRIEWDFPIEPGIQMKRVFPVRCVLLIERPFEPQGLV